jgi:hypothetical protein
LNGKTSDIEARARELFDQSVERIDAPTQSRLTQARHAALAELERPAIHAGRRLPAGALAAATVLAVVLWAGPGTDVGPQPVLATAPAEDLELLTLGDDLDMLGEDAEFYVWAASTAAGNGAG